MPTTPLVRAPLLRTGFAMFVALNSTGCAMSYENYANDLADASCAKFSECDMLDVFGGTEDACLNYQQAYLQGAEGDTNVCPNYDSKSAKDCVTAWDELTCSQLQDAQTPAVCDSVCSAGSNTTVQ